MTGPAHFQEAARLLTVCTGPERGGDVDRSCTAAAGMHIRLAELAARVTAEAVTAGVLPASAWQQWLAVCVPAVAEEGGS